MTRLLSTPRKRLYAMLAAVAALAISGGIAQAALTGSDSGPKPPARPLAQAVLAAVQAPKVDGITASLHVTNNLLPAGTLPGGASSPLTSDADGRLWLSGDGRLRLDLTTGAGKAQVTYDGRRASLYDESSNTLYTLPVQAPADAQGRGDAFPMAGLQEGLGSLLRFWNLSGAKPSTTAGRPSYTVRISPKDDGGLLGAAELAWDAEKGVPLRAAVYAQGNSEPVLEIAATKIAYGPVAAADLKPSPHANPRTVEIDPERFAPRGTPANVHGVDAVQRRLDFTLSAPDELAGLPRKRVELVSFEGRAGAMSVYGQGLGTIVVFQSKLRGDHARERDALNLPEVNIDGLTGKELATALGTLVTFERGGVNYVVAGLVPPVAAENAARGLK
jgi:hypothetical protein